MTKTQASFVLSQGSTNKEVSMSQVGRFPAAMRKSLESSLREMAVSIEWIATSSFESRKIGSYSTRRDGHLSGMIEDATTSEISRSGINDVNYRFFDLQEIAEDEVAFWTFEKGHPGREDMGFMPFSLAQKIAENAIQNGIVDSRKRDDLMGTIDDNFKGKYGDGIMVFLDWPLFFSYPEIGDARKFINRFRPYEGARAFDAISYTLPRMSEVAICEAADNAFKRL